MVDMDRADLLLLYRQMLLIRRFEERSAEMQALAKIADFLHWYIGEEAAKQFHRQLKKDRRSHPSIVALALHIHPDLNGSYVGDAIRRYEHLDIGNGGWAGRRPDYARHSWLWHQKVGNDLS